MSITAGSKERHCEPLFVTQTGRQRIVVGLGWDPRDGTRFSGKIRESLYGTSDLPKEGEYRIIESVLSWVDGISLGLWQTRALQKLDQPGRDVNDTLFDLDLYCFIFDRDGNFQAKIGVEAWDSIDPSGTVYHSGENTDGFGGPDDEQIHIELNRIPESYRDFFFIVESDSRHDLSQISSPRVRLADSQTNKNQLAVNIQEIEGSDAFSFVFCRVYHDGERWVLSNISEFTDFHQDWSEILKQKYIALT